MTSYLRQKFQSLTVSSEDAKDAELTSEKREEMEQNKIQAMKALVIKQDPSAKVTSPPFNSHYSISFVGKKMSSRNL